MERKSMVSRCPVCESGMVISELKCERCGTSVRGTFQVPQLCRLPEDLYEFTLVFVRNRGVIREVEKELGISYPTVRARLDSVIAALGFDTPRPEVDKDSVIRRLEAGEISPEDAERLLRGEEELEEDEDRVEDEEEIEEAEE
jgi:hypothetical protein